MRGFPRTLTFHLTGAVSGGSTVREVRVSPRLDRQALIRSIELVPVAGTAVGQFIDVLISQDDQTSDASAPLGYSIFEGPQGIAGLPVEDQDVGLPVVDHAYDVPLSYWISDLGQTLKVVGRFAAPATAPPACHVVIVLEEFDGTSSPIEPRPPFPPAPAPAPPDGEPLAPAPAPTPPYSPPLTPTTPVPPYVPVPSGPVNPLSRYCCPIVLGGGVAWSDAEKQFFSAIGERYPAR